MLFFLVQTVIISLTGVMAPGPITAATVGTGTKSPHAGGLIALGHGLVEIPLMVVIYFGFGRFLQIPWLKGALFLLGGAFLLFMGFDMLRSIRRTHELEQASGGAPFAAGIMLSLGNAYFLLWWATVGASLITRAVAFGLVGVLSFAVVHWLCDLVWYYFLSIASYKGGSVFGVRFQQVIFGVCGVFLLLFGGLFIADAVRSFM